MSDAESIDTLIDEIATLEQNREQSPLSAEALAARMECELLRTECSIYRWACVGLGCMFSVSMFVIAYAAATCA